MCILNNRALTRLETETVSTTYCTTQVCGCATIMLVLVARLCTAT